MNTFDLMVIGTGSGLDVASDAAEMGLSVAVVEEGPFAGTCHNRGCIPSKMLIHSADVMETIRTADRFGIRASVESVDWPGIMRRVFTDIDEEAAEIEEANRSNPNITVFKGSGQFTGPKTLEVNGESIGAETVLIAAGTRPMVPPIDGLDSVPYMTSDEALRLTEQPESMIIVGGGYIAAEMAHFYGAMGTDVTIVNRGANLLRMQDHQISRRFTEVAQSKFDVRLHSQILSVAPDGNGVRMEMSTNGGANTLVADKLLLATGRISNADRLQVQNSGVEVDGRGFVSTNEYLETNVPGVWALGDIVGRYLLKHSANLEAAYVGHNMFNPDNQVAVDYNAMPAAVFSSPQVASVGITEQEAEKTGTHYVAATYDYSETAYGASILDLDGFVKVLADPETREILGCHIIGTHAAMLIQEVANAMRMHLTTDAVTQSIYVHPALPEVVQRAFGELEL